MFIFLIGFNRFGTLLDVSKVQARRHKIKVMNAPRRAYSIMGRDRQAWRMHITILNRLFGRRARYTRQSDGGLTTRPVGLLVQPVAHRVPQSRTNVVQALPQQASAKQAYPLYKRTGAVNHLTAVWFVG